MLKPREAGVNHLMAMNGEAASPSLYAGGDPDYPATLTPMRTTKVHLPKTAANNRKEAILVAAAKVFARKGYGSTRIVDVAKEAKLSYGLAYYYFSSRDKLFHQVLKNALDATMAYSTAAQRMKGSSYAKLRSLTEHLFAARFSAEGMPDTLVLVQAFTHTGIPKATRMLVDARMLEFENVVVKMIRGAQAEGHAVGKDPLALATMLKALLLGFSVMRITSADASMPDVDTFLSFLS
jgi:AcrR family transcriptional regulator